MKKVTIQDIADSLGISRNTVSKAINNADGLADATRERILQKAVEMGYKQFSYMAAFAGSAAFQAENGKNDRRDGGEIALLTTKNLFRWTNHFAVPTVDHLKQELSQLGYTLTLYSVDQDDVASLRLPSSFHKDRLTGVVCIETFDRAYAQMVCGLGLPTLFIDGPHKGDGVSLPADQLYMENTGGITQLVNDMLAGGVKRIGFIGDYEHCQSFFERYLAFRCAMMLSGAPVDERYIIKDNTDIDAALSALPELPELFICANDFVASDVLQALRKQGKSVPGDVMLSGFDDAPESRIMTPALTTVHIHTQIIAYTAADLLHSRIREPELDFRTVYTQTDLIYRDSAKI